MRHLLKAVFDCRGDAQRVLDTLLAAGYAPAAATLTDVCPRGPDGRPGGAPGSGCHILELAVGSVEDAKRAAAIIGRFAAVDTEVVPGAGTWRDTGPDDDRAGAPPAGTTFQETMGAAAPWPGAGIDYRDIDRTAIGYGREMRGDDRYRDLSWDEAEPHLKIGWEMRHPGALSAWETLRDAIRHGWHCGSADTDDWPVEGGGAGPDQAATQRNLYWQDVEADLAAHRERLGAGAASSAWQRMKAAVRHGWQRVRH
jgi:hypothetical protein